MPSSITQSQLLPILAAIVAFLFAALLLVYIYRLLFGRRIKAPGSRNRPRRLDVVDTFDVDGDRQLVIVRRDNVEHLLLIGGPNDLLVEASISRVEAREQRPREKEAAGPGWPLGPVAPAPAPAPILPPISPAPPQPESEAPKPEPAAPTLAPLPPDLFAPPPAKPAPPPAPEAAPARPGAPRFTPQRPPFTPTPRPPRPAPPFLSRAAKPAAQPAAEAPLPPPPPAPPPPPPPPPEPQPPETAPVEPPPPPPPPPE